VTHRQVFITQAAATMKQLRGAALNGRASMIVRGHLIECRYIKQEIWMVDSRKRSAVDTLAFLHALYNPQE
jgi:hypothetical protein